MLIKRSGTGDFEFAGYTAYHVCYNSFFAGEELTQLEQRTATQQRISQSDGKVLKLDCILWQAILIC